MHIAFPCSTQALLRRGNAPTADHDANAALSGPKMLGRLPCLARVVVRPCVATALPRTLLCPMTSRVSWMSTSTPPASTPLYTPSEDKQLGAPAPSAAVAFAGEEPVTLFTCKNKVCTADAAPPCSVCCCNAHACEFARGCGVCSVSHGLFPSSGQRWILHCVPHSGCVRGVPKHQALVCFLLWTSYIVASIVGLLKP
jgi:hypothetical protein